VDQTAAELSCVRGKRKRPGATSLPWKPAPGRHLQITPSVVKRSRNKGKPAVQAARTSGMQKPLRLIKKVTNGRRQRMV
jgi:hypothetical protein